MASLVEFQQDPTLEAVDRAIEARARQEEPRTYLGMSALGKECARALWYSFRGAARPDFDAATLKRFEDGHLGEDLQAKRLQMVNGIELLVVDPATGKQFGMKDLGGHLRGHMDGAIHGLLQAPKTWHVWEHKSVGEDKFKKIQALKGAHDEKQVLERWDVVYFVQAQLYMHYTGMHRHYLTCSTPGGRQTTSVRTEYDQAVAIKYIARAESIIFSDVPPGRISNDPKFYQCGWCEFSKVCHGMKVPNLSCRTCVHATPEREGDGRWSCKRYGPEIPVEAQLTGCGSHLPLPSIVAFAEPIDAAADYEWIKFRRLDNHVEFVVVTEASRVVNQDVPVYASAELSAAEDQRSIGHESMNKIRAVFDGARVVG